MSVDALKAGIRECDVSVKKMRRNLINYSRRVVLSGLLDAPNHPACKEFGNAEAFKEWLFNPHWMPSSAFGGFAQRQQELGFILESIFRDPAKFARAVVASSKEKNFQFLLECTVPALFGYFTSREHLEVAIKFYQSFCEIVQDKSAKKDQSWMIITALKPLLRSASLFRFSEYLATKLITVLLNDANVKKGMDKGVLDLHVKHFIRCLESGIVLIPHPILQLLQFVRANCSTVHFDTLFFNALLLPCLTMKRALFADPFYCTVISDILNDILRRDELKEEMYEKFLASSSVYNIPELYECFGHSFREFLLTGHDILLVVKIMNSNKVLPDNTRVLQNQGWPSNFEFHVYSYEVFVHDGIEHSVSKQLFFGQEGAKDETEIPKEILDSLLNYRFYGRELERYADVVAAAECGAMRQHLLKELSQLPCDEKNFIKCFDDLRQRMNMHELDRLMFIAAIESNYKKWLGSEFELLLNLDERFQTWLDLKRGEDPFCLSAIARAKMSRSKRRILVSERMVEGDLHTTFSSILAAMKTMKLIQEQEGLDDSIYTTMFLIMDRNFLSNFILLNSFAMKNSHFMGCTDEESSLWLRLESVILSTLKKNPMLLGDFTTFSVMNRLGG